MPYDWQSGGFGLYLHWPFCESKCPYCDFNSYVSESIDPGAWRRAYQMEIERYGATLGNRVLHTVYFGGGTPSLMAPELVNDILQAIRRQWRTVNDIEVTLEANPSSVEIGRFRSYRDAGVNRISLGVQALDDASLRALGRLHTKNEALKALEIANKTFDRVNFDLIYARQHQTLESWRQELTEAIMLAGDHLSLYQLTVEEGTAFYERASRGRLTGLPDESLSADMFELTQELTSAAGFPAYEISNHAKPGSESRHNLIYWRGGDYVGIGPGAHGRISTDVSRRATEAHRSPARWLKSVTEHGSGDMTDDALAPADLALEYLLMSLRTREGLSLRRFAEMSGKALAEETLAHLEALKLIEVSDGQLRTTTTGRPLLNAILRELAP